MEHSRSAAHQSVDGLSMDKSNRSLAWGISIEIQGSATTYTHQPSSKLPVSCSSLNLVDCCDSHSPPADVDAI